MAVALIQGRMLVPRQARATVARLDYATAFVKFTLLGALECLKSARARLGLCSPSYLICQGQTRWSFFHFDLSG